MGRFAVSIYLLFCLSFVLPSAVRAAKLDWLYDVDVVVADQSAKERAVASREALLIVLKRVTGLADVPTNAAVTNALESPQSYYVEYRYHEGPAAVAAPPGTVSGTASGTVSPKAPAKTLYLSVRFAEPAVQRLVAAAGLPLWSSNRPTTVVWLVMTENTNREVLGASDSDPLLLALRTHAQERGLPLVVPLMDLDEQLQVSPAVVWSGTFDVLERASQRYSADAMLIGRVSHDPAGTWTAAWELRRQGSDQRFNIESPTPDAAGSAIVDRLTEELVARYAVASGDQKQLEIRVDGIATVADYGALLAYLAGLEFIDAVRIDEVGPNVVHLSLNTHTQWDRLRDLLALDGRLEPQDTNTTGALLSMTWRGDRTR
jgi:hypothetical protein